MNIRLKKIGECAIMYIGSNASYNKKRIRLKWISDVSLIGNTSETAY